MHVMQELERLVQRANHPGVFRRDHEGQEQPLSGYNITLTHPTRDGKTKHVRLVILAPSFQAAKVIATKPYSNATILSCETHHLSNPTILRLETVLEEASEQS